MTYEEKRKDLISGIKVAVIVILTLAGIVGGILVWISAGKEKRDKYKQKVAGVIKWFKDSFQKFSDGRYKQELED